MNRVVRTGPALASIALWLALASAAPAADPADFTVILLPDTQIYSAGFPDTYLAQTRWIRDHAKDQNIRFVIHLGDIVNTVDEPQQWQAADRAHKLLDGVVPYSVLPGNHDLDQHDDLLTRQATAYERYFSPARFQGCAWYGGHLGEGNENNYCFFEADAKKFLVVSLEFCPNDAMLEWADHVIAQYPKHQVIVATHCYMRPGGRDTRGSENKGLVGNSGQRIWDKLIRKHENIFLVVSGHVLGVAHQTSTGDAGKPVHELLVDYQGLPDGGDGYLARLRFQPVQHRISVEAYSPTLDRTNRDPSHTYLLPW